MSRLWKDQQSGKGTVGLGWSEAFVWVSQQSGTLVDTEPLMCEEEGGLDCARSMAPDPEEVPGREPGTLRKCCRSLGYILHGGEAAPS